jgi:hypothetical protein
MMGAAGGMDMATSPAIAPAFGQPAAVPSMAFGQPPAAAAAPQQPVYGQPQAGFGFGAQAPASGGFGFGGAAPAPVQPQAAAYGGAPGFGGPPQGFGAAALQPAAGAAGGFAQGAQHKKAAAVVGGRKILKARKPKRRTKK